MNDWHDYPGEADLGDHTVVGTLKVARDFYSPQLTNRRDIWIYLPPSYGSSERQYPVLYMHDGQNLFDRALIPGGEWEVDETMEALGHEGLEAIVVGIAHMGIDRATEYAPHARGREYLAFVVETLKPAIDGDFRTLDGREHTGIIGSSYGAQISLYGYFRYPEVFGCVGAFSTAWWQDRDESLRFIREAPTVQGKVYVDTGTQETDSAAERYIKEARLLREMIQEKGYRLGADFRYVEEDGGIHHETAWARRLPAALRFLLGNPSG
jgi:predicted alpha/beta superfamily hydrolase